MANVTLKADQATLLPLLLGVVALILGIISMFTGWWTLSLSSGGGGLDVTAAPFDQGNFNGIGDEDDLGTETLIAGLLMVGVLVALLAFVVFSIMRMLGMSLHPALPAVSLVASILLGATAVVLAWTTWPSGNETTDSADLGFWDSRSGGGGTVSTYAGAGWYLGIVGAVLVPAIAAVLVLRQSMSAPTSSDARPLMAPAPLAMTTARAPPMLAATVRRVEASEPTPALDQLGSRPVRKPVARKAPAAKAKKTPTKATKKR